MRRKRDCLRGMRAEDHHITTQTLLLVESNRALRLASAWYSKLCRQKENRESNPGHHSTMQDSTQPSTTNIALACAILAGVTGYFLGTAKSLGLFGGSPISEPPRKRSEKADESEDESSDEEDDNTVPAEFPGHTEECKMVLVVRTDLGMTKGILDCHVVLQTRY